MCKQCADEVLIIDSGSTDNTVAIAEKNGAIVRYRAWDDDFAAQRNFALEQTSADWVLYLDADERMDETMCREISLHCCGEPCGRIWFKTRKLSLTAIGLNMAFLHRTSFIDYFPAKRLPG